MATERVPMRKIREILRLKWVVQRSHRDDGAECGGQRGRGGVGRRPGAGPALTWATVEALSDDAMERPLYGPTLARRSTEPARSQTWSWMHRSCAGRA